MQSVSLCDEVRLRLGFPGGIRAESGLRYLPNDRSNLAVAAALAFRRATGQNWQDLRISLTKRIPVCAGTAGGSSDAAAVLRGLNALTGAACPPGSWPGWGRRWGPTCPTASWGAPPWPGAGGSSSPPCRTCPPASSCCASPGFPSPPPPSSGRGTRPSATSGRTPRL